MSIKIIDDGGINIIDNLVTQFNNLVGDVSNIRSAYATFMSGGGSTVVTSTAAVPETALVAQTIILEK